MSDSILRLPAVIQRTGLSRSTIYARLSEKKFPEPVRLGGARAMGFLAAEIDAWITEHAGRRAGQLVSDQAA